MNYAHLHLLLNHFPIIGTIIGLSLLLLSFVGDNRDLRRSGLIIFAAGALLAIPAFLSGFGARIMLSRDPGVSSALLERHEAAAMLSLWFMETTGGLALVALWRSHRTPRRARWHLPVVVLFALLTVGLMGRTGETGGDIRHPEMRASQEAIVVEGTLGSVVHAFEPTPEKFSQAVVGSLWLWGPLMFLHFVGLVLIVGTEGGGLLPNGHFRTSRTAGIRGRRADAREADRGKCAAFMARGDCFWPLHRTLERHTPSTGLLN